MEISVGSGWRRFLLAMVKPYYNEEGITIYNADCRDVLPQLEPVDLVLTDPPYGVMLGERPSALNKSGYGSFQDSPEVVIPLVLKMLELAAKITNRIVMTPGVKNMFAYPKPDHCGSIYYPSGAGCNSWGFSCWQPIFYYGKDPYGGKGSRPDSFSSVEAAQKNGHPCPKPIGQWKKLLERVSLKGETVLDPFMGSGTTLVAAKALGLKAIGVEISKDYCDIAIERLRQRSLFASLPAPELEIAA